MLTESQRTQVWEQWLAAEMRAIYFGDLCGSFHRRQRLATWSTLLLSSGAVQHFSAAFFLRNGNSGGLPHDALSIARERFVGLAEAVGGHGTQRRGIQQRVKANRIPNQTER